MSTRARYEGDVSAIAGVLSAFMSGPGSITYGKDGGKKLDKRLLQRHGRLVRGLHNLQEHWSFRVGDLKKAIKLVGEEKQWGLTKKELDEVVQHIPRRVQLLCRHVSQASTRKPPPAWFDDMMADEGDTGEDLAAVIVEEGKEEKEASDEGDTGEGAPAPAFFFGWDAELQRAWRCPQHDRGAKEFADKKLSIPPGTFPSSLTPGGMKA